MRKKFFLFIIAAFMATSSAWALGSEPVVIDALPYPVYMQNIQFDYQTKILSFDDTYRNELTLDRCYSVVAYYRTNETAIIKGLSSAGSFYSYGYICNVKIGEDPVTHEPHYTKSMQDTKVYHKLKSVLNTTGGTVTIDVANLIDTCMYKGYADIHFVIAGSYKDPITLGYKRYETEFTVGESALNNYIDISMPKIGRCEVKASHLYLNYGEELVLTYSLQGVQLIQYSLERSMDDGKTWNGIDYGYITTLSAREGRTFEYKYLFNKTGEFTSKYRIIAESGNDKDTAELEAYGNDKVYFRYPYNVQGYDVYYETAGTKYVLGAAPDCKVYKFDCALPVEKTKNNDGSITITYPAAPMEYSLETPTYTVKFWNSDRTLLKTEEVVCGGDATAPEEPTMQNLIFDHWSADFTNVHRNLNIYARYTMAGNYSFDAAQIAHTNKLYPADGFADSETRAMMGDSITFWASLATPSASKLYYQTARRNAQGEWIWNGSTLVGEFTAADVAAGKAKEFTKTVSVFYNYYNEQYLEQGFAFRFMVNCGGESIFSEVYEYDVYYPLYINSLIDDGGMYETLMVENTAHDIALGAENLLIPARYQDTIHIYRINGGAGACMNFARVNKPQPMYALEDGLDGDGNAYVIAPGEKETLNVDVTKVAVIFDGATPTTYYDFTSQGLGYKGNAYYAEVVNCGGSIRNMPADPANGQQTLFIGWQAWGDYADDAYLNVPATGDSYIGFTAMWEDIPEVPTYMVIFFDKDGNILSTQEVKEGENAVPPVAPEVPGFHFVGWDSPYTTITNDKDITALYGEDNKTWTVTYLNWDNSPLGTEQVNDGEAAQGVIATRTGYTFVGWSEDISSVKSDMTVTALFEVSVFTITYTIDGVEIMGELVSYGEMPSAYQAIEDQGKPATEQYVYTFSHWNPAIVPAVADATYEAVFTPSLRKYLVRFQNWDHTLLSEQQVEYGKAAQAPADPTREGYTFKGWDREFNNIIADMTVTALFEKSKEQGIDQITNDQSPMTNKLLLDGNLYIIRPDGTLYNAQGAKVK